jgi:hypothetical protein
MIHSSHFQELFTGYTVEPVTLSETEFYCSHFGRFDFDGERGGPG